MFDKKKKDENTSNVMYNTNNLVVATLAYVTPTTELFIDRTNLKYLFEVIKENGKTRYKEIFTGTVTDLFMNNRCQYYDFPYVENPIPLREVVSGLVDKIPKGSMLILLDKINSEVKEKSKV